MGSEMCIRDSHGGGYFAGSVTSHKNLISQISNDSDLIVYFFEYRLSPEYIFPSAHEDAKLAVDFISALHPDDQSIWIGESAGGGLATGLVVDKEYFEKPDNLILLSPWLDLSDGFEDKKFFKNSDVTIIIEGMFEVGEYYAGDYGAKNPILSPVYADVDDFPEVAQIDPPAGETCHDVNDEEGRKRLRQETMTPSAPRRTRPWGC